MEAMQDENCCQEFEEVYNLNRSSEDWLFDQIASQLQEIVIDQQFQDSLAHYMQLNWNVLDTHSPTHHLQTVFSQYQAQMRTFLQNNIRRKVPEFDWKFFQELLKTRKHLIDDQILDTLQSLENSELFLNFIADYRSAHEEEERLRVLTVKTNKVTSSKPVKGKDNIFSSGENHVFPKGLKNAPPKKRESREKTECQLLVPELILTVKAMRKG